MDKTDSQGEDRNYMESVIKGIVKRPDAVVLTRSVDSLGVLLTLEVAPEDMATVIGKGGQTAMALRTLLRVFGSKNNDRVNMKILEPPTSNRKF